MTLEQKKLLIQKKEQDWKKERELLEREYTLKAEKKALKDRFKEKRNKIANSKILVWFLFINCTIIEIFTILVTIKEFRLLALGLMFNLDLQPLIALISTVVAEVIGFSVYSLKSVKENTEGGIVYETAMYQLENEKECDDEEEGYG